jgi:RHS repeat-associated protein
MLLGEYDASGGRDVRYAYAGGFAPVQVAYDNGSGEDLYDVHTDHLDTPRLLTDDTGAVAWQSSHEAYGDAQVTSSLGAGRAFNIRFPGQYQDAETGLHYNRFRYYDPGIGRYISADPIGQAGGLNVYCVPGRDIERLKGHVLLRTSS